MGEGEGGGVGGGGGGGGMERGVGGGGGGDIVGGGSVFKSKPDSKSVHSSHRRLLDSSMVGSRLEFSKLGLHDIHNPPVLANLSDNFKHFLSISWCLG